MPNIFIKFGVSHSMYENDFGMKMENFQNLIQKSLKNFQDIQGTFGNCQCDNWTFWSFLSQHGWYSSLRSKTTPALINFEVGYQIAKNLI